MTSIRRQPMSRDRQEALTLNLEQSKSVQSFSSMRAWAERILSDFEGCKGPYAAQVLDAALHIKTISERMTLIEERFRWVAGYKSGSSTDEVDLV